MTDRALDPIVPLAEVLRITGFSEQGIRRAVRGGRFPAPIYTRPMRWTRADLDRHWSEGTARKAFRRSA